MGFEYALVHLKYTIPPGIILSLLFRPFLNRLDVYKILALITIAVLSTIPWDSYLIRHKIWTYPDHVTIGLTFFLIPVEEIFFFVIQTYNTALIYLLLNRPLFHPRYLRKNSGNTYFIRYIIQSTIVLLFTTAVVLFKRGGEGTYLSLILLWALPFVFLLWSLSSKFLINLPYTSTIIPIAIPTLYLWVVDTIALRRGTWSIENGTKLGIHLWPGLEIEEAIFFLITNVLVVFGLAAFDHSLTILMIFPTHFPDTHGLPTPYLLFKALVADASVYDEKTISGLIEAVETLRRKSRSFYLASATFPGRLRLDMILLYAFCRVADDLVDNAKTKVEAHKWIYKLTQFLDLSYGPIRQKSPSMKPIIEKFIVENFPESTHSALELLPCQLLSSKPLYDLLEGFKTDLNFLDIGSRQSNINFPIIEERHLENYAAHVAGTVAELCLELVFHHSSSHPTIEEKEQLLRAGRRMGVALQYVNIARDIETDACMGRIYFPTLWLKEENTSHDEILKKPNGLVIEILRSKLLAKAFNDYYEARRDISQLPLEARAPMRVAVESYMEIGRVLKEKNYQIKKGKATVPLIRRLRVAWKALTEIDSY
ncbi:Bifunctional lycopene cyclase/phytoene synthase [Podosphaera aphanis]|nr:Bifunctional lycopene cyclase/phytoene synthase [Podosphaera aphanis]